MSRIVGQDTHRYRHAGSGSGGYAFAVLRYAAERLFNIHLPLTITDDSRVFTRQLANHDLQVCGWVDYGVVSALIGECTSYQRLNI